MPDRTIACPACTDVCLSCSGRGEIPAPEPVWNGAKELWVYRGFHIEKLRADLHGFIHDNYDGGDEDYDTPSRDRRHGAGGTLAETLDVIDELCVDEDLDVEGEYR